MTKNAVEKILSESQFEEVIDGVPFVLRMITGKLAAEAIGNKTLGLVRGGQMKDGSDLPERDILSFMEKYLTLCMVSPKVAEVSNPETDEIALDDLGGFGPKILQALFQKSGFGELGNSEASSGDTGEKN